MAALGDRPAAEITTREINQVLRTIAKTGVSARTVERARALIHSIYVHGMKPATFELPANPVKHADRRKLPQRDTLNYYSCEEAEALARALHDGRHRDPGDPRGVSEDEQHWRRLEDAQDAEIVRVAAYAGLRRGELIALRWRDVDFTGRKIVVRRTMSGSVEMASTKSRRVREVPLARQTAAALDRLSRREDFTQPTDYVFCSRVGERLDGSALYRRFVRARNAAGLRPLRFHDLRHSFGSLLVAAGMDPAPGTGGDGPLDHHHHEPLPPRPARGRTRRPLLRRIRSRHAQLAGDRRCRGRVTVAQ